LGRLEDTNFLTVFYLETNAVTLLVSALKMATLEACRGASFDDAA
jgi:hypothetical protein